MPSIAASSLISKASTILQDVSNVRWTSTELLGWLNDGQREICIAKPDACVINKSVLQASGTKQTLGAGSTSDAVLFLGLIRNMSTNGTTAGNAIRPVSREILDTQVPGWHAASSSPTVQHFTFDPTDPLHYYIYPPNDGTGYVEVVYAAAPTALTATTDTITISDIFANCLVDYMLYRAYSKDAEYAADAPRAVAHYQAFASALGMRAQTQNNTNPNAAHASFNPNVPGGKA